MAKFFKDSEIKGLKDALVSKLDNGRGVSGIPWIVTSGLRTPERNAAVGGVEDSSHLKGLAADIRCLNDEQRYCIIKGALAAGFTRIGVGKGHIHLDIDPDKAQNIIFVE